MIVDILRDSILESAFRGKLVENSKESAVDLLNALINKKEEYIKINHLQNSKSGISKNVKHILPDNWVWTTIGEICFVTKLAGFEYTKYMAPNLSADGEIPVVRAKNIKPNNFIDKCDEYISSELSNSLFRCALNEKCVLMTFIGAGIGEVAVFDKNKRYHLAPNVAKIVPSIDINKYLMYYFMSPSGRKNIFQYKKQTAQPSLSMETIRNVIVPLPPLNEQERIVNRIEQLLTKLYELKPIEDELTLLKSAFPKKFIKSILQDFMHINNECDSNIEKIKMKDLVSISTGKKDANYGSENGMYNFFTCSKEPIKCDNYSFEGESILLAGNGNIGNINYYDGKFEAYQRTYVLQQKSDKIDLKFLYYHLLANWEEYNNYQIFGTAIPYIKLGNVQNYVVNCPSLEEQKKIVNKIEQILPLCDDIEKLVNE